MYIDDSLRRVTSLQCTLVTYDAACSLDYVDALMSGDVISKQYDKR